MASLKTFFYVVLLIKLSFVYSQKPEGLYIVKNKKHHEMMFFSGDTAEYKICTDKCLFTSFYIVGRGKYIKNSRNEYIIHSDTTLYDKTYEVKTERFACPLIAIKILYDNNKPAFSTEVVFYIKNSGKKPLTGIKVNEDGEIVLTKKQSDILADKDVEVVFKAYPGISFKKEIKFKKGTKYVFRCKVAGAEKFFIYKKDLIVKVVNDKTIKVYVPGSKRYKLRMRKVKTDKTTGSFLLNKQMLKYFDKDKK